MNALQVLVAENTESFIGAVTETELTLSKLESLLGVALPSEVTWFWLHCGSGDTGAAPNAETAISDTFRYRKAICLPCKYIVLEDRNDGGSIFLDTETSQVAWVNAHAVESFARGSASAKEKEYELFTTFSAWVADCLEQISD